MALDAEVTPDVAAEPGALLARAGWKATMIQPLSDAGVGSRSPYLRKQFSLDKLPNRAELRISALGLYACFINGQRVGDDVLTPGWTSYHARLSYQTYDVTKLLREGENTIDIWLADGWMRSQIFGAPFGIYKTPIFNTWGDKIGAIAELTGDGRALLATDTTWRSGLTPVMKSGIYFGEIYDAREENVEPSLGVERIEGFSKDVLVPHEINGIRELEPFPVVASTTDKNGRTTYDFGQNLAGYVHFTARGERGARVTIEHAEVLDKDGTFSTANLRLAEAQVVYVLKGGGEETYKPHFTFHGFRHARVTIEGDAEIVAIESVPITSAVVQTGSFECGNALINRLVQNTIWSQRSNFIDVPTDCPQRDERLGWTGDAQVFAGTACYLHDSHWFLRKWLRDVMVDQREDGSIPHVVPDVSWGHEDLMPNFRGSTGWGDAICVIPWVLYTHYGDREALEETLSAMERWVDFIWSISDGPIVYPPRGGAWAQLGFTFGDWLQPKGTTVKPLPTIGDDAAATIYLYISSDLTAKAAEVVGNEDLATRMRERATKVRDAFQNEFIAPSGRLVYDDQTSYALAILHDLVPDEMLPRTVRYFVNSIERTDGRIGTGFIGTPALLPALVKAGAFELAEYVFLQEDVPGWLFQVRNGATTIWERWDAIQADGTLFDPAMNSYNHYAYGAVCQFLFESAAGFRADPEQPGFDSIIFEPVIFPRLAPVAAHHDAPAGRVEAAWDISGEWVNFTAVVPEGATGTLVLARRYQDATLDGEPIDARRDDGKACVQLEPGTHRIRFRVTGEPEYPVNLSPATNRPMI